MGKVYQRAVMRCPGIIFPTPYPQGYGATPPLPRPPQSACDVPGSMPEAAPYGNAGCVSTSSLREQETALGDQRAGRAPPVTRRRRRVTAPHAPHRRAAPGSAHGGAMPGTRRRGGVQLFTGAGRPRGVRHIRRPVRRYTHRPDAAIRAGSAVPPRGLPDPARTHRTAGAYGRSRIVGVVRRSNDGFRRAQPIFSANFSPLPIPWRNWPINPLATRQEETRRYASTRRGRAMNARRTSLHGF